MKSIEYYRNSRVLKEGISCILFTKDSEKDVDDLFISLKNSQIDEILVSDEFSKDETVNKLKKYDCKIFLSKENFLERQKELLKNVNYKYVIIVETDQRFTNNYSSLILDEFKKKEVLILQSLLRVLSPKNYFEKGMALLYEFLKKPGKTYFFTGPCITYSEFLLDLMNEVKIISNSSIDTIFNEHLKKNKCEMFTSKLIANQEENISYQVLKKKFGWYGKGDYYFYKQNRIHWSFLRKIKSLTHVFIRYFIMLPLYSFLRLKPHLFPFFFLCGFIRYNFFLQEFLKKNYLDK